MGLDNGICIKRNELSMKIYDKLSCFEFPWDDKHRFDFEIAYWRKCWNVREMIADCLGYGFDNEDVTLDAKDILNIIDGLEAYDETTWNAGASIWSWEEAEDNIQQCIHGLKYLAGLMDEYKLDVYFYDSY